MSTGNRLEDSYPFILFLWVLFSYPLIFPFTVIAKLSLPTGKRVAIIINAAKNYHKLMNYCNNVLVRNWIGSKALGLVFEVILTLLQSTKNQHHHKTKQNAITKQNLMSKENRWNLTSFLHVSHRIIKFFQ